MLVSLPAPFEVEVMAFRGGENDIPVIMGMIAELKRRKVVRTAVAYLAAAFVAAQGVQLLVEGLDLPSWIFKAVMVLLLAAFPFVIGLAWAFDITPDGVQRTDGEPDASNPGLPAWRRVAIPAAISVVIILASFAVFSRDGNSAGIDQNLVAVLPFRVSGDPQIEYLREGMVDMLAAKLTGEGGPRAADPRAVGNAVKQHGEEGFEVAESDAAKIARSIGAGQVLIGSVVGTPARFTINAKLLRVPGGAVLAQAEQSGSADSLLTTVDHLVGRLLSLQAGEGPQSLAALTTTSLSALRAYLDGRLEYRNGRFGKARERFANALDMDSTFALAGIGLWMTSSWGEGPITDAQRTVRSIANNRDRLGAVDRAMADAILGKDWPRPRTTRQRLAEWDAATRAAPDRPDAWFWYADVMHHGGLIGDHLDAYEQADALFSRVLQLDSAYMPALIHRMDIAIMLERPDTLERLEAIRKARDPSGVAARYQHSYRIRVLRDSAAIKAEMSMLDTLPVRGLMHIGFAAGLVEGAAHDGIRALEAALKRNLPASERIDLLWEAHSNFLMYGMPARAQNVMDEILTLDSSRIVLRSVQIMAALYWNADSTVAQEAANELVLHIPGEKRLRREVRARCALEHWRLAHNDLRTYAATAARLGAVPADSVYMKSEAEICRRTLTVLHAAANEPSELPARVKALNEMLKDGPPQEPAFRNASNLVLSRGAEQAGDLNLAHRAASRLGVGLGTMNFATTMWREQARLAALTGKKEEAIRLYRRHLMIHENAEPAIQKLDDPVRAHLAELTGERR